MAHLYKHLRIHQVFGANTDVGKTVLTTALCRTAAASKRVYYLKPLSTGPPADADDGHILRHAGQSHRDRIRADCLHRYSDPVSPHLAAKRDQSKPAPTDAEFIKSISSHIRKCAVDHAAGAMFVETAGGVHSPTLLGTLQADAYRPLLLPTILVADPRLGGISSTISAYESLHLRGYSVDLVLCMLDPADSKAYLNHEYLAPWFAEKGIAVCAPPPPPPRAQDSKQDQLALEAYYASISDRFGEMNRAENILDKAHTERLDELRSMPERATNTFWWPFVQHDFIKDSKRDITTIDSAHGDSFSVHSEPLSSGSEPPKSLLKPYLDGSASWWTQSFGHSHPRLALAAAHAAGRYGHVLFPLAVHAPALELAERLVQGPGKDWADRVFYSDDGSTAVEVALKMAVRAVALRRSQVQPNNSLKTELGVLGIKGSYHGDTIGAMDACEGGVYNASVEWHRERGFWFDPPTVGVHDGVVRITVPSMGNNSPQAVVFPSISAVYDINSRLDTPLAEAYREHIRSEIKRLVNQGQQFGALMIEPIVLGAGGMLFVDPLFQRTLVDVVRSSGDLFQTTLPSNSEWTGLPIVFDEVFTGFHRLGPLTSASMLELTPDIAVYAKILTGGVVPLSATLATNSIFRAFNFPGAKKIDALLHGHSYSAHPVGCAVATAAIDEMKIVVEGRGWAEARDKCRNGLYAHKSGDGGRAWSLWDPCFVDAASKSARVEQAMSLGTVFAMTLRGAEGGYQATIAQDFIASVQRQLATGREDLGLNARTLGDVVYFMGSLNTGRDTFEAIEKSVLAALKAS